VPGETIVSRDASGFAAQGLPTPGRSSSSQDPSRHVGSVRSRCRDDEGLRRIETRFVDGRREDPPYGDAVRFFGVGESRMFPARRRAIGPFIAQSRCDVEFVPGRDRAEAGKCPGALGRAEAIGRMARGNRGLNRAEYKGIATESASRASTQIATTATASSGPVVDRRWSSDGTTRRELFTGLTRIPLAGHAMVDHGRSPAWTIDGFWRCFKRGYMSRPHPA
jgi:hypothetical protein